MSINVMVGSDPDDIPRINDTISSLTFLREILVQRESTLNLSDTTIDEHKLEYLIDWYKSMRDVILYAGNTEDVVLDVALA